MCIRDSSNVALKSLVLGGLNVIYNPHKSPTAQCCPSYRLQKWSKLTEISLIFTICLEYTASKCPPSQTNELKVFGRLESTHFYERHLLYWALYTIVSGNNYKWCSHIPPQGPWNWLPGRTNGIRGGSRVHSIQLHSRDCSRVTTVLCTAG